MTHTCKITQKKFTDADVINYEDFNGFAYKIPKYGIIKISSHAYDNIDQILLDRDKRTILRGHILNHNITEKDEYEITLTLLNDLQVPDNLDSFEAKRIHLLKYIDISGGPNRHPQNFNSMADYYLTYSNDSKEFIRICKYLNKYGLIEVENEFSDSYPWHIMGAYITDLGKETVNKLFKISVLEKLTIDFYTGDESLDTKLIHAKDLFYKNEDFENKRSACKTLSDILEPIREKMKHKYFYKKDVETFFDIVNNFDIRHNNLKTKIIEYEEQLDWIFFSLLNSIIAYYRMVKRYE